MSSSSLKLESLTGNYHECCPLFVDKSDLILCASGSIVHAVSSKTGELVGVFNEHSSPITSLKQIVCHDKNVMQILSSSLDGTLCLWNLKSFKLVKTYKFSSAVYEILVVPGGVDVFNLLKVKASSNGKKSASGSTDVYLVIGNTAEASANEKAEYFSVKTVAFDLLTEKTRDFSKTFGFSSAVQQHPSAAVLQVPSATGAHLDSYVVIAANKRITLYSANNSGSKITLVSEKRGNITCVAVNQERSLIVTGHEFGELTVWRDMAAYIANHNSVDPAKDTTVQPVKTTLHWHAHAVSAVNISTDGAYLYSAGLEGVLVIWQLSSADGSKSFFPRLGAPATHLTSSVDIMGGVRVAVTTTDNCVRIVNTATMKEDWTLKALCVSSRKDSVLKRHFNKDGTLKKASTAAGPEGAASSSAASYTALQYMQSDRNWNCQLRLESRSDSVVCNGYPGQLQAFNSSSKSISNVYQVVNYVRVSKKESNTKMYVPSITHFEFVSTPAGHFMVTVDVRKGDELDPESSLKFWDWHADKATYRLSAQMDSPHGNSKITSIACTAVSERGESSVDHQVLCASSSQDGVVKVWRGTQSFPSAPALEVEGATSRGALRWTCAYSFKYRDCPANSLAFSPDGSLLSVSYQNLLTLWDPTKVSLKGSLVGSSANNVVFTAFVEPKASVKMGGGCGQALLVVGTRRSLSVFNLLTMKLVWSLTGSFGTFSVAKADADVLHFSGADSWIAASCTIKGKTEGEETDGESGASDVEGLQPNADGSTAFRVLMFGLHSSKPVAACNTPAKINSMVFCKDAASGRTQLLCNTESSEVLRVLSSRAADGKGLASALSAVAQVSRTVLPGLADRGGLLMEVDEGDYAPLAPGAVASSGVARSHVNPNKAWLQGLFDASTENIPSLSLVCDEFMDGLLRLKKPTKTVPVANKVRSDSVVSVTAAEQQQQQQQQQQLISGPAVAVPAAAESASPETEYVNFDVLEREFDASLFACFANPSSNSNSAARSSSSSSSSSSSREEPAPATAAKEAPKSAKKSRRASEDPVEVEAPPTPPAASPIPAAAPSTATKSTAASRRKSTATSTMEAMLHSQPPVEEVAPTRVSARKRSNSTLSDASSAPSEEGTRKSSRNKK